KHYNEKTKTLFNESIEDLKKGQVNLKILPYPQNQSLSSIINRAVDKKAPFEGKNKESDKGFKDVVLWESLLEHKANHAMETILLYTADGRFLDKELEKEYDSKFGDKIYLIKKDDKPGNKDLFSCIETLLSKSI